jgi:hypothetical protein
MTVWCVFSDEDLLSIHLTEKGAYEELEVQREKYKYSTVFVEKWEAKA